MPAIPINRKHFGVFLLMGVPFIIILSVTAVTHDASWWSYCFMFATIVFPWVVLVYQFITDVPVSLIQHGYITIPRLGLRLIRIPLSHVRHDRIVRTSDQEGEANLFEAPLTMLPPELAHLHNTFSTHGTINECKKYGGYQPPEEPFLILQTPQI
jgi:hypothetical protein